MNATKTTAKKRGTKSALLTSLLSLLLCVTMLIGTTFAWFTDSVTSGENQIIAGNLDLDVEYWTGTEDPTADDATSSDWKSIAGESSLFSKGLWEPGHTEVVYLRVINKGTLAFNYTLNVSPISETGGINQADENFQLSDYMCFAASDPQATPETYDDRAAARKVFTTEQITAAVNGTSDMLQPMQESEKRLAKTLYAANAIPDGGLSTAYMALVVYMPEEVGNGANYKTGTEAPTITLGVTAYAWQKDYEKDSFSNDYDGSADLTPDNDDANIVEFDYFPQVNIEGQLIIDNDNRVVKGNEDTQVTATPNNDDGNYKNTTVIMTSSALVEGNSAAEVEMTVLPNNTESTDKTSSVSMKVYKDDSANANFTAADTTNKETTTYDVTVTMTGNVTLVENTRYKVKLFIGKNRTNVKMYHNSTAMKTVGDEGYTAGAADTYTYDASTGYVTMYVDSFSPFTAVYDQPVCAIGTTAYYSLKDALAAVTEGKTILFLTDAEEVLSDTSSKFDDCDRSLWTDKDKVTVDFANHKLTVKSNYGGSYNVLNFFGTGCTLKNGEIVVKRGENYANDDSYAMAVECEGTFTMDGMTLHGGVALYDAVDATLKDTNFVMATNYYAIYLEEGAKATIVGGQYKANGDKPIIYAKDGCSAVISGGTYTGAIFGGTGTLSITGGTFSVDPSAYVAKRYEATNNGDATWTVQPIDIGTTYFSGGKGTEAEPYLIGTAAQMQSITDVFYLGGTAYYKVSDGVETIDCDNWNPVYLNGSFDGNGVTFKNLDNTLFNCISDSDWSIIENSTIENFTISDAEIINNGWRSVVVRTAAATNCKFENVNVSGYVEGAIGVATFVCFGPGNYDGSDYSAVSHFVFENCVSSVTTVSASGNSVGFIAHAMADADSTVELKNSSYTGSMSAVSLADCKYVVGNWYNGSITDDNQSGSTLYSSSVNGWKYIATGKQSVLTTATGKLPDLGSVFSVDKVEGATKAVVAFTVSPNAKPDSEHTSDWGCLTSTYYAEAAVTDTTFTSTDIKYVTVRVNPEGVSETGFHDNYYDIVADWAGHSIGSSTTVRFIQYDNNGNILRITTFDFNDK